MTVAEFIENIDTRILVMDISGNIIASGLCDDILSNARISASIIAESGIHDRFAWCAIYNTPKEEC